MIREGSHFAAKAVGDYGCKLKVLARESGAVLELVRFVKSTKKFNELEIDVREVFTEDLIFVAKDSIIGLEIQSPNKEIELHREAQAREDSINEVPSIGGNCGGGDLID